MTDNLTALAKIANLSPSTLRELLFVNEPFTRREQVKRHYRTRGDLVAAVYSIYLNGSLNYLSHGLGLPDQKQAGVP